MIITCVCACVRGSNTLQVEHILKIAREEVEHCNREFKCFNAQNFKRYMVFLSCSIDTVTFTTRKNKCARVKRKIRVVFDRCLKHLMIQPEGISCFNSKQLCRSFGRNQFSRNLTFSFSHVNWHCC